jgi:hypothetical protein
LSALCLCVASRGAVYAGQLPPEVLHDDDIAAMARAGLSDGTIVLAIEASECQFDVSPGELIELRKQQVTDTVIRAMLAADARARIGSSQSPTAAAAAAVGSVAPAERHETGDRSALSDYPVEFSAQNFVTRGVTTVTGATVRVGRDRLRVETDKQTLLIDTKTLTGYAWHAGESVRVMNRDGVSRYLLPAAPEQPCRKWRDVECQRIGPENVAGRATVKWEVTVRLLDNSARTELIWVDERLNFITKLQAGPDTEELRNIIEQKQPPTLFDPPQK